MEERVVLVISAANPNPTVTAGRTRLSNPPFPPVGNNPSFSEKRIISISPNQKLGMEVPNKAKIIPAVSFQVF